MAMTAELHEVLVKARFVPYVDLVDWLDEPENQEYDLSWDMMQMKRDEYSRMRDQPEYYTAWA